MTNRLIRGIVMAAGESSRFWPLAQDKHKAFYKAGYGKTVLEEIVSSFLSHPEAQEMDVIVSPRDKSLAERIFSNEKRVRIVVQEKPLGQANAILTAHSLKKINQPFFYVNADKVNAGDLLERLLKEGEAISVVETPTPEHYGIALLNDQGEFKEIVEKPKEYLGNLKVTGAYFFQPSLIPYLEKYQDEKLGVINSYNEYFKTHRVKAVKLVDIPDTTLKFPWELLDINQFLLSQAPFKTSNLSKYQSDSRVLTPPILIEDGVEIGDFVKVVGPVKISQGAKIGDFVKIIGPVYIGPRAKIGDHSVVRENCYIGEESIVGFHTEIKNSILGDGSHTHRNYIGDSVIDEDCRFGAGALMANRRLDRGEVKSEVKGQMQNTHLTYFGAVLGKAVKVGVNASLMPGVKIGQGVFIMPGEVVKKDLVKGKE